MGPVLYNSWEDPPINYAKSSGFHLMDTRFNMINPIIPRLTSKLGKRSRLGAQGFDSL